MPEEPRFTHVGRSVPRLDARDKATGRQLYLTDVSDSGDLWVKLIRSPHPKAKLIRLNREELLAAPGVVAVYSADDVPARRYNPALAPESAQLRAAADQTLLTNLARHVGDGVAAVVATTPAQAESAVRQANAQWVLSEPALDIDAAVKCGEVIGRVAFGDPGVEDALSKAGILVTETFEVAGAQHVCLETHSSRAMPHNDGVVLWSNTQSPAELRRLVAEVIGIDECRIRIRKIDEGGGFGCRQEMYEEALLAWIAMRLMLPVRSTFDRLEEFQTSRRRHGARITVTIGLGKDGTITAIDLTARIDSGAYASHAPYVTNAVALAAKSLYPHAKYRFHGEVVRTNTIPGGAYRGYGVAQVNFAVEAAVDAAARKSGLDPVEVRRRNAMTVRRSGHVTTNRRLVTCVNEGARRFGWPRNRGDAKGSVRRGSGVAIAVKGTSSGEESEFSTASVLINPAGGATLITGTCDASTGSSTVLAQIVAEELDIAVDEVSVVEGDTAHGPVDAGSAAQRSVYLGAGAARDAARAARIGSTAPVTFHGKRVPASYCACFVTVSVDIELGSVQVDECLVAIDCGRVLNPLGAAGQVHGGAVQGLGLALVDLWHPGKDGSGPRTIQEHGVPTALDVPDIEVVFTGEPIANAPYGGLGMGELPIVPIPAAVTSALAHATGRLFTSIPLRPPVVWEGLQQETESGERP